MHLLCSRRGIALVAFLSVVPFLVPAFSQAVTVPADWERIVDKPRELSFEVSASKSPDGDRWISLDFEFEVVLRAEFEKAVNAYWFGMERADEIFSRVDSVRVLRREPTLVVAEQATGVRILGLAFLSLATFRNELLRPSPESASIDWDMVESDGSMRGNSGGWYFKALRGGAEPRVYVRYEVHTEVEARFPGQAGIMERFGPGDVEAVLRQFSRELYGRSMK